MTNEDIAETAAAAAAAEKIANLCDNISRLVDEKAELTAANERLAVELKACIAEKGELQKQLRLKNGMGIQQNQPETFSHLKGKPL